MNKRNFFSLLTLTGVAVLSIAGIMQAHHDDCKTHVLHRTKRHCRQGQEVKSETTTRDRKGRTTKTKTKMKKEAGKPAHYKREVRFDD